MINKLILHCPEWNDTAFMDAINQYPESCRVCGNGNVALFAQIEGRDYWRCGQCQATFLDTAHLPDPVYERSRYCLHENDVDDPRYRTFLNRLAQPLLAVLPPDQTGLDYGCGPGPALAAMLREAGHQINIYDPFFYPDTAVLDTQYDFITCTEVAEHFHRPLEEFQRLNQMLRPGGWLGIMTCFQTDDARFANWHYRRDPTHVCFYKEETLTCLAKMMDWECTIPGKDVALMRKKS